MYPYFKRVFSYFDSYIFFIYIFIFCVHEDTLFKKDIFYFIFVSFILLKVNCNSIISEMSVKRTNYIQFITSKITINDFHQRGSQFRFMYLLKTTKSPRRACNVDIRKREKKNSPMKITRWVHAERCHELPLGLFDLWIVFLVLVYMYSWDEFIAAFLSDEMFSLSLLQESFNIASK